MHGVAARDRVEACFITLVSSPPTSPPAASGTKKSRTFPGDQVTDLENHREVVDRALAEAGLGWDTWPMSAATAPLPDRVRLSALLLLLAAPEPRVIVPGGALLLHDEGLDVIDRLRRRRLPWDRGTARLALDVVAERAEFDDRRVAVALRGAQTVCASGEVDVALLKTLQSCATWLEAVPTHVWGVREMRLLVLRVIAAASPPDLLDLSLLRDGDAWVGPARSAATALSADNVTPLVRMLGELGPRRPSGAWLRDVKEALRPTSARALLKSWLELAADTDVVPPDEATEVGFSGGMLFAYGNDEVVRAAVLATQSLPDAWVSETLGVLARRGAATSGVPGMTASLALKVATAAVDTLAVRGTPADRAVLEDLLVDLSRRDLVKRVGAALGQEVEAAKRDADLRREKAATVRRKADPAPRQARAAVDVLIRRHVGPGLRRQGFTGGARTWRRRHADRVDVIGIGSGDGRIHLSYGTRFDAAHPDGEPFPVEPAKLGSDHLDIHLLEFCEASVPGLDGCARHLEAAVVPFLDSLGRYELARAYLEHNAGAPGSAERREGMGSQAMSEVLGMLALAAGDRVIAVEHLERLLVEAESWAESADATYRDTAQAYIQFWRTHLDRARLLP